MDKKVAVRNCLCWLHGLVNSVQLSEIKHVDREVENVMFWKVMVKCSVFLLSVYCNGNGGEKILF